MTTIRHHVNSLFNSLSYRYGDIIFDPGDEWKGFMNVDTVLLTHGHFDHIYGLNRLIEINPDVKIYTNERGREMLFSSKKNMSRYHETPFEISRPECIEIVQDGQEVISRNGVKAKAVFTPGHNPSCVTWIIGDNVFCGDSYIPGLKTVTNLPGADKLLAEESVKRIMEISINKNLYPGHSI